MTAPNKWDRARMDAGIADPGFPHANILEAATALHRATTKDDVSFDELPEDHRVHWLARGARTVLTLGHPLYPDHIPAATGVQ